MHKIVPHLWYDTQAKEAAEWYGTLFPDSAILSVETIMGTPSGDTEIINFQLAGQEFLAISAGPYFSFNPSISLMVHCATPEEVDRLWNELIAGGSELMKIDTWPFSPRYGWLQDRYGLSWQLMCVQPGMDVPSQRIVPSLLFSDGVCGAAEEAIRFYCEVFDDAELEFVSHYAEGEAMSDKAKVNYAAFRLHDMRLSAMDHAMGADFTFTEAFSILVRCDDQAELDKLWDRLTAVPESEQCGWLKDKYGVSWQIVPANLEEVMKTDSEEESERVMAAFLTMGKLDVEALARAKRGE